MALFCSTQGKPCAAPPLSRPRITFRRFIANAASLSGGLSRTPHHQFPRGTDFNHLTRSCHPGRLPRPRTGVPCGHERQAADQPGSVRLGCPVPSVQHAAELGGIQRRIWWPCRCSPRYLPTLRRSCCPSAQPRGVWGRWRNVPLDDGRRGAVGVFGTGSVSVAAPGSLKYDGGRPPDKVASRRRAQNRKMVRRALKPAGMWCGVGAGGA